MRYLGLDLGSRTLGMALSDRTGLIASSYKTIRHHEDYDSLIPLIGQVVLEEKVDAIVLGFPKNMNNTLGEKARLSLSFQKKLEDTLKVPVYLQDERMTSIIANQIMLKNDTSRKKRKEHVDALAATIILQSYLDLKKEK